MNSKMQKLADNTLELIITIPQKDIKESYQNVLDEVVKSAEIKGFRKGKAPKKLVEESVDKNKIYSQVLEQILPEFYARAVKEQNINPVINPKISVVSMEDSKDWVFKAQTCQKPEIVLGEYKKDIQGQSAKDKIWLPGQKKEDDKGEDKNVKLSAILELLLKNTKIILPGILIEDEVNRLLSQLLDEIKKLGLTLDQYLASTGKTAEILRKEQEEKAIKTLKLEFILNQIAESESIIVNKEEIDKAISQNPDKKAQEALAKNTYFLASVLRRQKTLDYLLGL